MCDADDDQKCAYVAALVRECLRYVTVLVRVRVRVCER
jgi:3-hydroxyphenylacetate 6-hydroxylase